MLMAWGPFRFTVPNYSVETIRRTLQSRAEPQAVIGAAPLLHRTGPGNEEIVLESTFHPRHFNGRGLQQLQGVRQAVNAQAPLQLVHINSAGHNIFGQWLATSINNEETLFDTAGTPQTVTVTLNLTRYDQSNARMIAMSAALGGLSVSAGFGFSGVSFSASLELGF